MSHLNVLLVFLFLKFRLRGKHILVSLKLHLKHLHGMKTRE